VTLLKPALASLFIAGNYALMTGLDLMGYGYPRIRIFSNT